MYRLNLSMDLSPVTCHAGPSFVFESCAAKYPSAQRPRASERCSLYGRSQEEDRQHISDTFKLACSWIKPMTE